jgi:hypothetical protein
VSVLRGIGTLWSIDQCDTVYAVCRDCGARTVDYKHVEEAIAAWNRRADKDTNVAAEEEYGICRGTKEQDKYSCGGDRTLCDFYPEVREKVESEDEGILYLKNVLDILYEYSKLTNYDVICEVSVIDTVIGKMKNGEWT